MLIANSVAPDSSNKTKAQRYGRPGRKIIAAVLLSAVVGCAQTSFLAAPDASTMMQAASLVIEKDIDLVRISGAFGSAGEIDLINQRAAAVYGAEMIINDLQLVESLAPVDWIDPVFDTAGSVTHVDAFKLAASDGQLIVGGNVASSGAAERVSELLSSAAGESLAVTSNLVYPQEELLIAVTLPQPDPSPEVLEQLQAPAMLTQLTAASEIADATQISSLGSDALVAKSISSDAIGTPIAALLAAVSSNSPDQLPAALADTAEEPAFDDMPADVIALDTAEEPIRVAPLPVPEADALDLPVAQAHPLADAASEGVVVEIAELNIGAEDLPGQELLEPAVVEDSAQINDSPVVAMQDTVTEVTRPKFGTFISKFFGSAKSAPVDDTVIGTPVSALFKPVETVQDEMSEVVPVAVVAEPQGDAIVAVDEVTPVTAVVPVAVEVPAELEVKSPDLAVAAIAPAVSASVSSIELVVAERAMPKGVPARVQAISVEPDMDTILINKVSQDADANALLGNLPKPEVAAAIAAKPLAEPLLIDDADGDGVMDHNDECDSRAGYPVDGKGCQVLDGYLKNVRFYGKTDKLTTRAMQSLDNLAEVMQEHPQSKIAVLSYTSNSGSPWEVRGQARERARSVVGYLVKKGIGKERLQAFAFGHMNGSGDQIMIKEVD